MNSNTVVEYINRQKFSKFHVTMVALGVLLIAFTGYAAAVYGSIVPVVTKEWDLAETTLGMIASSSEFGTMLGALLLSYLSDRLGAKKTLITAVLTFGVFTFLQSLSPNAVFFAVCRFIAGVGFGGVIPIVITLLTEYSPKNSKSQSVAISLCGNQIGSMIAPLLAILIIPQFGWRPVLWLGIIPILFVAFIITLVPESLHYMLSHNEKQMLAKTLTRIDPTYQTHLDLDAVFINNNNIDCSEVHPVKKASYTELFNRKYVLVTIFSCLIYMMGLLFINGVIVWLPEIMTRSGYPLTSSIAFSIFLNLGTIIGTAFWARVADKKGFNRLLPALYATGAVTLMIMSIKTNLIVLYTLVLLIGFFLFAAHSLVNAFVSQYYPDEIRASAVGLPNSIGRFGGMLGPIVGGALLQLHASITVWFATFAGAALIAAVSFVIVIVVTHRKAAVSQLEP